MHSPSSPSILFDFFPSFLAGTGIAVQGPPGRPGPKGDKGLCKERRLFPQSTLSES